MDFPKHQKFLLIIILVISIGSYYTIFFFKFQVHKNQLLKNYLTITAVATEGTL